MPELIHVGIDVSKDALEVACGPQSPTQCFTNDDAGHEALVNVLHVHRVDLIVMEATGGYEAPCACALQGSRSGGGGSQCAAGARLRQSDGVSGQD